MKRKLKTVFLLFYFVVSIFLMEMMLKAGVGSGFDQSGVLIALIFSVSYGAAFFVIASFFKGRTNHVVSMMLLGLSGLVFSSQIIYYKFFKTFYTMYSAANSGQVFEFWKDILAITLENYKWIVLFFIPLLLLMVLGRRMLSFNKATWGLKILLLCVIILFYGAGLGGIYSGDRGHSSAYDLYFRSSYPVLSVEKLGLITTMRLDLQRLISGWSPVFEAPVSGLPVLSPDDSNSKPQEVEYNTINIDFQKLASQETDEVIRKMHQYFEEVEPTAKNDYTGKFEGYNLIFITAEAFSPYAVHPEITPTLYKMVHEGYNFTNFYTPLWGVSTSDGEYVACTGLLPKSGVWSFQKSSDNYLPFVMGNQLRNQGYKTRAYHNHTYTYYKRNLSHPNMGYDYKGVGNGLNVKKSWPASDLEMMQLSVPEYIDNQPFHTYYMTVSGHMQYNFIGNAMAIKNKKLVLNLPYTEAGKAYMATQIELDRALEHLLNKLEEAGAAHRTLIAISPDHYPYGLEEREIDDMAGGFVERNFELERGTFILYAKGMEPKMIDKPCSSLDIIPTLSNLLGLEYDSRLLMGKDIFSDSQPLVIFLNKSFITDKGRYNGRTGEFVAKEGIEVDQDYINQMLSIVNAKFYYSAKILDTDYYRRVLVD